MSAKTIEQYRALLDPERLDFHDETDLDLRYNENGITLTVRDHKYDMELLEIANQLLQVVTDDLELKLLPNIGPHEDIVSFNRVIDSYWFVNVTVCLTGNMSLILSLCPLSALADRVCIAKMSTVL